MSLEKIKVLEEFLSNAKQSRDQEDFGSQSELYKTQLNLKITELEKEIEKLKNELNS